MAEFKTIGLVARTSSELVLESLRRVQSFLSSRNIDVLLEDHVATMLGECTQESYAQEVLAERCDLVICCSRDDSVSAKART